MPTAVGPNTSGRENLVFGYDLGDNTNSFPGIPAVNCSGIPSSRGGWSVTEITDGSIAPHRKEARVFKFVAGTASNLYRQGGYYSGGGFTSNNNTNPLILGRTSPDNFTTVSEANKYRYGFWVKGVSTNTASWGFYIDIGDKRSASYTVGNNTDWYFIDCVNDLGINSTTHPYDFFDIFTSNQGLTIYVSDMGIMRSPGTVDSLPIIQAYPQWVDYGQERNYTSGLKDLTGNHTIDLTNVSFDSNAQMTFDGSNDYIALTGNILNVDSFTVEAVVNITSVGNNNKPIFVAGDLSSAGIWFFKHRSGLGNRLVMHGYDGVNPRIDITSTNVVPDAENTYVAVTFNGTSYQLYINGVADGSSVPDNKIGATTTNYIGKQGGAYLDGDIPMMKIYSKALTASEIKTNFNAIKGRFNI